MKQNPSRMGIGASSILLILVVLSLTLFAVLSLVQARSDAALTDRTALGVNAFYDADARAQQVLARIDDALKNGRTPDSVDGVTPLSEGIYVFSVGSADGHTLNVRVNVSNGCCSVTGYRYENASEWIGENAQTVWQGD